MENFMQNAIKIGIGALALLALGSARSEAQFFAGSGFDASTGKNLSASADFSISGNTLTILLCTTSDDPVKQDPDVLTGLFWDINGDPALGATSADRTIVVGAGSSYINESVHVHVNPLGDHWAYKTGLDTAVFPSPNGAYYGVAASGLGGVFGSGDTFTGSGGSPAGVNYGLMKFLASDATNGLKNGGPQISNCVEITLTGDDLTGKTIGNVWFQYGSGLNEPGFPPQGNPVPEPSAMALLMGAGVPLSALCIRRRRA
jgi:hypothetical protein